MNKFENVDVLAALEQIMRQNTAFYQGDVKSVLVLPYLDRKMDESQCDWTVYPTCAGHIRRR